MSINIDTASREELKQYANDEIGLKLTLSMTEETMRTKIRARLAELGKDEPEVAEPKMTRGHAAGDKANWVTINIARAEGKFGDEPVFVGWNGKGYRIPRGIAVAVPPAVEHILRNAVRTIYEEPKKSGDPMIERQAQAYPYQVVAGYQNVIEA